MSGSVRHVLHDYISDQTLENDDENKPLEIRSSSNWESPSVVSCDCHRTVITISINKN